MATVVDVTEKALRSIHGRQLGVTRNSNLRGKDGMLNQYKKALVTLTHTDITDLNTAPVTIVAAPGAGKAIVIEEVQWYHAAWTAYTGSEAILFLTGVAATQLSITETSILNNANERAGIARRPSLEAANLADGEEFRIFPNQALTMQTATTDPGAGTAANVLYLLVTYQIRDIDVSTLTA